MVQAVACLAVLAGPEFVAFEGVRSILHNNIACVHSFLRPHV